MELLRQSQPSGHGTGGDDLLPTIRISRLSGLPRGQTSNIAPNIVSNISHQYLTVLSLFGVGRGPDLAGLPTSIRLWFMPDYACF